MPHWYEKLARISQRNRQEIVHAKLSRREMVRLGLLTSAGTLAVKSGLSSRALAQSTSQTSPASPPTLPWTQQMPILQAKQPMDPRNFKHGYPDGTTPIDGATKRINHQLCNVDPETGVWSGKFPPKKFYELTVKEGLNKFNSNYAPSSIWGFDGI